MGRETSKLLLAGLGTVVEKMTQSCKSAMPSVVSGARFDKQSLSSLHERWDIGQAEMGCGLRTEERHHRM